MSRFFLFAEAVYGLLRWCILPVSLLQVLELHRSKPRPTNARRITRVRAFMGSPAAVPEVKMSAVCLKLTVIATSLTARKPSDAKPGVPLLVLLASGRLMLPHLQRLTALQGFLEDWIRRDFGLIRPCSSLFLAEVPAFRLLQPYSIFFLGKTLESSCHIRTCGSGALFCLIIVICPYFLGRLRFYSALLVLLWNNCSGLIRPYSSLFESFGLIWPYSSMFFSKRLQPCLGLFVLLWNNCFGLIRPYSSLFLGRRFRPYSALFGLIRPYFSGRFCGLSRPYSPLVLGEASALFCPYFSWSFRPKNRFLALFCSDFSERAWLLFPGKQTWESPKSTLNSVTSFQRFLIVLGSFWDRKIP